jgi:hypothetical protein
MAEDKGPETGRYSTYDNRLQRFVGGVHDDKNKAGQAGKAAAKRAGDTDPDLTVREV